jgi:outer membrane protein assembly factor BamB
MNCSLTPFILSVFAVSLHAAPGDILWTAPAGGAVYGSPAVDSEGNVYVGSSNGLVYSWTAAGQQRWTFDPGPDRDYFDSSPLLAPDGTLYIGCWNDRLYALDQETGALRWSYLTENFILSSPALMPDGRIVFGSADGFLHCLNPDGSLSWAYEVGDPIDASPAVDIDGTIFIGSYAGDFLAVNPDGTLRWSFPVRDAANEPVAILSSAAVDVDGRVVFGAKDGRLYCIEESGTGQPELQWFVETSEPIDAPPVISRDGTVYVASRDGLLLAIDFFGGETWSRFVGDVFYSAAAIDAFDNVYILAFAGNNQSELVAFSNTGTERFRITLPNIFDSSPVIDADGRLLFGGYDGNLYCVEAYTSHPDGGWPFFHQDLRRSGQLQFAPPVHGDRIYLGDTGDRMLLQAASDDDLARDDWQWFRNGSPIAGATGASLLRSDLSLSQVALYSARRTSLATGFRSVSGNQIVCVQESLDGPSPLTWTVLIPRTFLFQTGSILVEGSPDLSTWSQLNPLVSFISGNVSRLQTTAAADLRLRLRLP